MKSNAIPLENGKLCPHLGIVNRLNCKRRKQQHYKSSGSNSPQHERIVSYGLPNSGQPTL